MKVLLIDVNCKNGSTGNIVYNLYNYINSSGDEAAVCYGRGPKLEEKNIFKFGIDAETYLHALLTRITGFTGCFSFFSTRRLIKSIKEFNPDIVHIHELHAYFVNIKPLINYLKRNHIKTVMTLHCEFAYTGKCGHSVDCEQWKTECKKCPRLRNYISTMWFDHTNYMFRQKKKLFNDYDSLTLVAPSEWLKSRIKISMLKDYPVTVIHNGIDTNIFYYRNTKTIHNQYGISEKTKIILALAPHLMTEEKGGPIILEIAEKLKEEDIVFVLVGVDGVEVERKNNLLCLGPIRDKNKLAELYSCADFFLICSMRENYPTTSLEAQCCGTPVIGFDTGGTKETIIPNGISQLAEYGNINKLCEIIQKHTKLDTAWKKEFSLKAINKLGNEVFLKHSYGLYK